MTSDAYRKGFMAKLAQYDSYINPENYGVQPQPQAQAGENAYATQDMANVAALGTGATAMGGAAVSGAGSLAGKAGRLAQPGSRFLKWLGNNPVTRTAGKLFTPFAAAAGVAETAGNLQQYKANPGSSFTNTVAKPFMGQVADISGYLNPVNPYAKLVQTAAVASDPAYHGQRFIDNSQVPGWSTGANTVLSGAQGIFNPAGAVAGLGQAVTDWHQARNSAEQSQHLADQAQLKGRSAKLQNRQRWAQQNAPEWHPPMALPKQASVRVRWSKIAQAVQQITAQPGKTPDKATAIPGVAATVPGSNTQPLATGANAVAANRSPGRSGNATGMSAPQAVAVGRAPTKLAQDVTAGKGGVAGPAPIVAGMTQPKQTPPLAVKSNTEPKETMQTPGAPAVA